MAKEAVELAPSGRGKCAHCKEPIAQGALRFGFKLDGSIAWFHAAPCAAAIHPEKLEYALGFTTAKIADPERAKLAAAIEVARPAARRARIRPVDRAPTGRAACKHCKQPVARGTLRANVLLYDDRSTSALHIACASAYLSGGAAEALVAAHADDRPALAALLSALALLDANGKGATLERQLANGDTATLEVLADWLEDRGAAVPRDELAAALEARRAAKRQAKR